MDYTWPMMEHDNDAADPGQATAMDIVRNAWSLLRGADDESSPKTGTTGSMIAQASLAAAGGRKREYNEVEFMKQCWALSQQAMEEGWIAEWIEQFMSPDVHAIDYVGGYGQPTPCEFKGQEQMCYFYNIVLQHMWDNGRATVVWKPQSFNGLRGTGVVMAEFDIEVSPAGLTHRRQLWVTHVVDEKITDIVVLVCFLRTSCRNPLSTGTMEYTWISDDVAMADDEPQSSAMDYVKNAWALLRGNPSDVRGPETPKAGGLSIAQASLALAGGPAGKGKEFDEVEFFKHAWALYQQAMEEGWVAEWIDEFCTIDVKATDYIGSSGFPIGTKFDGRGDLCKYYNAVLQNVWNNGNSTVVWKPRGFNAMGRGTGVLMAEFDIEVTPRVRSQTRQLWIVRVDKEKISDLYALAHAPS